MCAHVHTCVCTHAEVTPWRAMVAMQTSFIFAPVGDGNLGKALSKGMVKLTSHFEFNY